MCVETYYRSSKISTSFSTPTTHRASREILIPGTMCCRFFWVPILGPIDCTTSILAVCLFAMMFCLEYDVGDSSTSMCQVISVERISVNVLNNAVGNSALLHHQTRLTFNMTQHESTWSSLKPLGRPYYDNIILSVWREIPLCEASRPLEI